LEKGDKTLSAQLSADPAPVPPPIAMLQLISGFWISRGIYITAKLGLADLVKDGAKTADELAAATEAHAPSLFRVLRAGECRHLYPGRAGSIRRHAAAANAAIRCARIATVVRHD